MSEYLVPDTELTALANAIRKKSGTSETLSWPDGFTNAVNTLKTEDFLETRLRGRLTEYTNENLTSIDEYGFYSCTSLTSIDLPAVKTVEQYAFNGCGNLTTVNIPLLESTGPHAFRGCGAKNLSFPELIEVINNVFQSSKLETISLPKCTSLGSFAFSTCLYLTTIIAPLLTSISNNAFDQCSALVSISLPSVTSVGNSAFFNCTVLETVDLPSLESIGDSAFRFCSSLTNVSLSKVTKISSMAFQNCTALTNASLPVVTSLGSQSLAYCSALANVTLGSEGHAITSIPSTVFSGDTQEGLEITVYTETGSSGDLTGAPWGATNATVTYLQA